MISCKVTEDIAYPSAFVGERGVEIFLGIDVTLFVNLVALSKSARVPSSS